MSKPSIKVLNIAQPNAHYIFHSGKNIENRTMATTIRGTVAIYASKTYNSARFEDATITKDDCEFGVILGFVDVVDCVTEENLSKSIKKWFHGPYGYVLANPRLLKSPIPVTPPQGAVIWWDLQGTKAEKCLVQIPKRSIKALEKSDKKLEKKVSKRSPKALLAPSRELSAIIGPGAISFKKAIEKISAYMENENLNYDEVTLTVTSDSKIRKLTGKKKVSLKELIYVVEKNLSF
ncbi:hypothetical protein [Bdellovibrio bacteriovorus]|uniref:hypothetical protein n=1 Tax=Bdellovibrio bacteriovorus TaxID=959 RepID=UPI0035A5A8EB